MPSKHLIAIALLCAARAAIAEPPSPTLGTAASFAVLAPVVTSSGATIVTGNLGGNTISGFPPGVVLLGTTLRNGDIAAPLHDVKTAYDDLRGRACNGPLQGDGLGPGVYCSTSPFTLQGTLTLDAHNDPNAVWIFQLGAGLATAAGAAVRVINGGWEGNVFWQVNGQVVLGDRTAFIGNVLASKGITFSTGASLSGRALVLDGSATLSGNSVSLCCKPIEVINPTNAAATANAQFTAVFGQTGATAPTFAVATGTLPTGIELFANGTLSGMTARLGTFPITVRVTDVATHCTGTSGIYVLVVSAPVVSCAPITITHPMKDRGVAGVEFTDSFYQTGAVEEALFTPVSLPTWLTLEKHGSLHGVPTETGTFRITVKVTGADGCFLIDPIVYILIIDCQTITVIVPTKTQGTAGVKFSAQFGQAGAIGTPTYIRTSGPLPDGVTLSSSGLLEGITNKIGCFTITVTVTDRNRCIGTAQYTFCIGCQTITVVPPVVTTGTTGTAFCVVFTATGILGTPVFSYTGPLPSGVVFINGVLCGTPTDAGCFTITVTVTDTNGCTGTTQYTFCIGAPPIICPPIVGSPTLLPPAVNGMPYSQTITATGGTPPYTFIVIGGVLPAGLALNPSTGVISGTPTVNADINVVVQITDAAGCMGSVFYYPPTIPAISQWGLVGLSLLLGIVGLILLRRGEL